MTRMPGKDTDPTDDPHPLQAPPFKLKVFRDQQILCAVVALKDEVARYGAQTEYWFAPESLTISKDLTFQAVPLGAETEATIDAWVSPLAPAFSCRRQVTSREWSEGTLVVAAAQISYLLYTAHPDDASEVLGLLLTTDRDGHLISAAWYRTAPPPESGLAFRSTSFSGELTLVRNGLGVASTDPTLIRDTTWYHIQMPLG